VKVDEESTPEGAAEVVDGRGDQICAPSEIHETQTYDEEEVTSGESASPEGWVDQQRPPGDVVLRSGVDHDQQANGDQSQVEKDDRGVIHRFSSMIGLIPAEGSNLINDNET
jgi:hypothetical protein